MPWNAKRIWDNMPWRGLMQTVLMILLARARMPGGAAILACAWLAAAQGRDACFRLAGMALGLGANAALSVAVLPVLLLQRSRLSREGAMFFAGALAVIDAASACGWDASRAPVWFIGGVAASVCAAVFVSAPEVTLGFADCPPAVRPIPRDAPARERAPIRCPPKMELIALGAVCGAARLLGDVPAALLAGMLPWMWPGQSAAWAALLLGAGLCVMGTPVHLAVGGAVLHVALAQLKSLPGPLRIGGALLLAGAWSLSGGEYLPGLLLLPAAAGAFLLEDGRSRLMRAQDDELLHRCEQRHTRRQLEQLADVLTDMAGAHASGPDPPREDVLLPSLRAKLCNGCVRYERCWNGRAGEGSRLLCELITMSVNGNLPQDVLPDMMRRCLRANVIPERLYAALERFSQMRTSHAARMDGAHRARMMLETAAHMLRDTAPGFLPAQQARICAQMCLAGLPGVTLQMCCGDWVLTRSGGWPTGLQRRAAGILAQASGAAYRPHWCEGRVLALRPVCRMVARTGWDGVAAQGNRSGDSVHTGPLDDWRQVVVISDGMGVGDAAAGESRRAMDAVLKFLRAGIPPDRAAILANRLLLAQGSGEKFATLDLCVIDNIRMQATWVKMAACDSYLLRNHDCSVIPGGRLPMGIVTEATPLVTVCDLKHGDVIVMGTDGAMEGLDPDTAQRCLIAHRGADATELARHMRVSGREKRVHEDDQTLAIICIKPQPEKRAAGI